MRPFLRLAPAVLVAATLGAATARGDVVSLDVGAHGGILGTENGKSNLFVGGVQARVNLVWLLAAEARVSRYADTYSLGKLGSIDVTNTPVQLSALFYVLKLPRFGLYVLGGGTYSSLKLEGQGQIHGTASTSKWAGHAGLGVDVKVLGPVSLNGDARILLLDVDSGGVLGQSLAGGYGGRLWALTGGVNFKLY